MIDYYKINEKNQESFPLYGSGGKNLLLLISDEKSDFILGKLQEIMKAIKYDLDVDSQYAFNLTSENISGEFITTTNALDIIVFDNIENTTLLNTEIKPYVPIVLEKRRMVLVEPLEELLNDKNKKFKFWQLLQKMFLK